MREGSGKEPMEPCSSTCRSSWKKDCRRFRREKLSKGSLWIIELAVKGREARCCRTFEPDVVKIDKTQSRGSLQPE